MAEIKVSSIGASRLVADTGSVARVPSGGSISRSVHTAFSPLAKGDEKPANVLAKSGSGERALQLLLVENLVSQMLKSSEGAFFGDDVASDHHRSTMATHLAHMLNEQLDLDLFADGPFRPSKLARG